MGEKTDILQGTLALMTLKTLETMGPLHGYGIARRIEQTSGDRLVINYGTLYGGSSEVGTTEQLLAPEATAIEFRYFDGTEWLTEWSSSDRSAVPVAVEILLTLRAPDEAAAGTTWLVASPTVPQEQTYRLLVHLPAGQPSSAGDSSLATESTSGDASSTTGASP